MLGRALLVSGEAESPARCTRTESVQPKVSKSLKAAGSVLIHANPPVRRMVALAKSYVLHFTTTVWW